MGVQRGEQFQFRRQDLERHILRVGLTPTRPTGKAALAASRTESDGVDALDGTMCQGSIIGLDLAKNVFQAHGASADEIRL